MRPSTDAETIQRQWATIHQSHPYEEVSFGYLLTAPNRKIVNVNSTLLNWLDYNVGEVVGQKTFQDLLTIGNKVYYETHQAALDSLQGYSQEISYTLLTKNRERIDVFVNSKQHNNEEGEQLFTEIFIFNFPERKKYEQELLKAKKMAEEMSDAKTRFISKVSHEIRTPINAITGVSDLLMSNAVNSEQVELLKTLQFSSNNLLELINDILDFSKLEQEKMVLHPVTFNFRKTLRYILGSFYPKVNNHRVTLELDFDESIPEFVLGDKIRIIQIVNNLVSNAIKFTHDGQIKISVQLLQRQQDQLHLHFSVSDTGIGITPEQRVHIFDSFQQADTSITSQYGGTGLGLSITKRLVELHDSEIQLDSEIGKGSTFHFLLNLQESTQQSTVDTVDSNAASSVIDLSNMRILLVEDNPSNTLIACRFFDKWKLPYDCALNGVEAVEKVQQKTYDVVLMDLNMPIMDGITAARHIRALTDDRFRTLPIVAMSASTEIDKKEQLDEVGIHQYVLKPFIPEHLLRTLQQFHPLATTTPNQPIVNLSWLFDLFGDDTADLIHYLSILTADWEQAHVNLRSSVDSRNKTTYANVLHQLTPTMKMLHLDELLVLLEAGELQIDQASTFARSTYFENVLAHFDRVIAALQNQRDQLVKSEKEILPAAPEE
jgi:signal transduction histidine kinase/CheY-like chemotaxis protein